MEPHEIYLTGTVGTAFWDEDSFTPADVREMLEGLSGPLTVHLNSGGGIATDGQAIYTLLKNYDGPVTVVIDGIAASAASLIAMAGDEIVMPLGAIMMIHDPATTFTAGRGTEDDHLDAAKSLGVIANAYAAVYAACAGISVEAARTIMRDETYYDGDTAVAQGFATRTDSEAAAPAAAFDYRLYPKAPKALRAISASLPRRRSICTGRSMMASATLSSPHKDMTMPPKAKPATASQLTPATASDEDDPNAIEEDDDVARADEDDPTAANDDAAGGEEDDDPEARAEDDEDDATASAVAVLQFCARANLGPALTARYMMAGMSLDQLRALHPKKGTNMTTPRRGTARASIRRDERETRRIGIENAIVARLNGQRQAQGPAQDYVGMTLVQMAQATIGNRDTILDWGDRERVVRMAMHSTSDFPAIFENALNKQLLERYALAEPTYRRIAKQKNFRDFRPMPLVRTGDFPMLQPIGEGGEIKFGTFGDSREQALISPYAVGVSISRQMIIDDELSAIDEVLGSYGESVALWEEMMFYSFALSAVMADGKAVFHADHGNLATAGAAITDASVSAGRAAMRKQKSIDGNPILGNAPSILLVSPDKQTEAERHVAETTPTKSEDVNVTGRGLSVEVADVLTGNAWYLISERNAPWVYGYLEGQEAPRLRTEEPFGRQGFSMTLEHDFGLGAADHRGAFKNPGA